jgi:hypothetical protein
MRLRWPKAPSRSSLGSSAGARPRPASNGERCGEDDEELWAAKVLAVIFAPSLLHRRVPTNGEDVPLTTSIFEVLPLNAYE